MARRKRQERGELRVKYAEKTTPAGYVCDRCGAAGCKLWREYQTIAPRLLCARCAEESGGDRSDLTRGGGDQIGWFVPAVPTEEGDTFWGYTPAEGCVWWQGLPIGPPFREVR